MGERFKKAIGVEGSFKDTVMPMINYCYTNIFLGGAGYIISMYFSIFLTRVVGLDIEFAGFITMVAVIWDGINDPIMGLITDRTRSRYGRHRAYLKRGIPFVFISYILLWNSFGLDGEKHPYMTVAYFLFAYVLYKTAYTIIAVPHTAMLPELAPEYNKRTQYTSVSYIFNSVGMIPSYIILLILLAVFGYSDGLTKDAKAPFFVAGIVLATMYSIAIYGTFKLVKEPSSLDMKNEPLDVKYVIKEYIDVFRSRSFRQYFCISFFWESARSFYSTTYIYYVTFLANMYRFYPLFNTFAGVFESAAFPLNYALTMKHGKKKCGTIVTPFMILGLGVALVVTASQPGTSKATFMLLLMLAGTILYPFGMSGIGFVCNNVFPDLTDVDEMITGRRREGVVATCNTMVKQVTGGINTFIVTLILGGFGLDVNAETTEFVQQTDSAIFGIRLCVAIIPMILALVSYILLRNFQMTKDDHTMIRAAIATKHKYGSVTLTDKEKDRCYVLTGHKLENTWLGKDNDESQGHTLDKDENGNYIILIEAEELKNRRVIMDKIDINQTQPTVKRSKLFDIFFYIIQWTWGLSVNIVGGIAYLICTKILGYKHQKFGYANIVYMPWNQGGLSMGTFIFIRDEKERKEWLYNCRIHEYGHTWQCLLLGPYYYIVVAIPSVIWCHCFAKYREKNNVSYYKLYCESWANSWGEKFSQMKRVETK